MYSGLSHDFIERMLEDLAVYATAIKAMDEEKGEKLERFIAAVAMNEGVWGVSATKH